MARVQNPTLIQLTQQLKPDYWSHCALDSSFAALIDKAHLANELPIDDPKRVDALREAAHAIGSYIRDKWAAAGMEVDWMHVTLHGDDTVSTWDEAECAHVQVPKVLHLHLVAKFSSRVKSGPLGWLASLAGVEPEYIEKGGRGGNPVAVCGKHITQSHDNMLAYLIHAKYPEKFQYPPTQVASVAGPNFLAIHAERCEAWRVGRAHVTRKHAAANAEDLRSKVLSGEVTKSQLLLTDEFFEIYARNQRMIDDALDAYGQRRAMRAAMKLQRGDFRTLVLYVYGVAGVGKTRFANSFIGHAQSQAFDHGERWELYRAATGNPLDDWRGEEIILLDDLRASAMGANDWLLLLDPYNASPAQARYRNKQSVAPRLIIITATIEPLEFFFYARQKGNVDEALDQFLRRLASVVKVVRKDEILGYFVNKVGRVEPYQHVIHKADPSFPRGSNMNRETLSLEYGMSVSEEHSEVVAVAELMASLADYSIDVPFTSGPSWTSVSGAIETEAIAPVEGGGQHDVA
jgi:hypothetical protein